MPVKVDSTHHMRALLSRISPNKLLLLLLLFIIIIMKTYNRCLVSFSNLVIVLINKLKDFVSSNNICTRTHDY